MDQPELRVLVRPPSPYRLPRRGRLDGVLRVRGGVVNRLLHFGAQQVVVRVAQPARDRVLFGAKAPSAEAAQWGIDRMRQALGVDQDLHEFYERFRFDPLVGRSVRNDPWLRPAGRPDPFEALAWAICEQLIEYERAAAIQRRLVFKLGRSCPASGLRDAPSAKAISGLAPAWLESLGLSAGRASTLIRAAQ